MPTIDCAAYNTEADRQYFARELDTFVPPRVFDAHAHLSAAPIMAAVPFPTGYSEYRQLVQCLLPGRQVAALFISYTPDREATAAANAWTHAQLAGAAPCRGLFYVKPSDDPEWVRQEVRRLGLHGLKCYHLLAAVTPTWQADLPDYLPEPLVQVANEEGWAITLHMVKSRAVADPANIHWIRTYCRKYPNMKLILAHSARGFQPQHNLEGLPQLTGLDNLYFDTSANCEPMAHAVILRLMGPQRVLFGTDFPISHARGRSIGVGDSFIWIYGDTPVWGEKHQRVDPPLVGMEALRALKWACWSERLPDAQVEDLFWNNAARLFAVG
jgi:glutamate-1-semialdehyde 2,1-aminomutase